MRSEDRINKNCHGARRSETFATLVHFRRAHGPTAGIILEEHTASRHEASSEGRGPIAGSNVERSSRSGGRGGRGT